MRVELQDLRLRQERAWKRNERLIYLSNFLHMTLCLEDPASAQIQANIRIIVRLASRYTMCFGGIFDIFLYHLSQEQQAAGLIFAFARCETTSGR